MSNIPEPLDRFSDRVRQCAQRIEESGGAALGGLFDLTAQRLVRLAVAITRNQHDAEDALQATLVRVAQRPQLICQAQQPWHYLLRMMRNSALLILRNKQASAPLDASQPLVTYCRVDEVELAETYRAIWTALRQLPTQQSEIVVLKIWEELTFQQIADVLEVPPATVASRYRYALEKLAVYLRSHSQEVAHE
ncbi:MAG: sigma-70 family RNA polymerase sigma factor [Pirellulaceae bacterium]|nr:sigma-70 family RNA polymerase sigma factor [Pirellulaceae bacterium]